MFCLFVTYIVSVVIYTMVRIFCKPRINYENKKVLVIGGTSGLGKSIASILQSSGAKVTVASRSRGKSPTSLSFISLDVTKLESFPDEKSNYDMIFCCVGISKPGYFVDMDPSDYQNQMMINYIGTVNSLYHFYKHNTKAFKFVMISSTVALYTFPGYSAYSPSKAALKSFYDSVSDELKQKGVDLYIYYVTSMQTPGFENENKIKPKFVLDIEGRAGMDPDSAAKILLNKMSTQNEIFSDKLTYLFNLKGNMRSFFDLLTVSIASIVFLAIRKYIRYRFCRSYNK